jgi:multidrug efflux pump subunit AcrA (membrane-fusion protein)
VVWVFDAGNMTVNTQPVQVGAVEGNEVVISSGLKPGQQVVSAGVHVLSPGQKVTVYNAPAPNAALVATPALAGASAAQR